MDLELRDISKHFASTGQVLERLSLSIAKGEFVTLLGPSGCGKSTLLRVIAGLETPTAGDLLMNGEVTTKPRGLSFVFQEPRLLPWRRALENVMLPLEFTDSTRQQRRARCEQTLALVGLERYARAFPDELSGGMRMRVSLARALVSEPKLMLLDEPFGALDEITRQSLNDELLRLWQEQQWTAIFVTHNIFEAVYLSQRVVVMGRHPGRILADLKVPFPYPRLPSLRADPAFAQEVGLLQLRLSEAAGS